MMKRSIWQNICGYFQPGQETVNFDHPQRLRLSGKKLRIPLNGYPVYRIEMGKQTLILSPDLGVVASDNESPCDFILFDPVGGEFPFMRQLVSGSAHSGATYRNGC